MLSALPPTVMAPLSLASRLESPPACLAQANSRFRINRITRSGSPPTCASSVPAKASRFRIVRVPRDRLMSDPSAAAIDDDLTPFLGKLARAADRRKAPSASDEDPLIDPFLH
jgi:hypothetical protein